MKKNVSLSRSNFITLLTFELSSFITLLTFELRANGFLVSFTAFSAL